MYFGWERFYLLSNIPLTCNNIVQYEMFKSYGYEQSTLESIVLSIENGKTLKTNYT